MANELSCTKYPFSRSSDQKKKNSLGPGGHSSLPRHELQDVTFVSTWLWEDAVRGDTEFERLV